MVSPFTAFPLSLSSSSASYSSSASSSSSFSCLHLRFWFIRRRRPCKWCCVSAISWRRRHVAQNFSSSSSYQLIRSAPLSVSCPINSILFSRSCSSSKSVSCPLISSLFLFCSSGEEFLASGDYTNIATSKCDPFTCDFPRQLCARPASKFQDASANMCRTVPTEVDTPQPTSHSDHLISSASPPPTEGSQWVLRFVRRLLHSCHHLQFPTWSLPWYHRQQAVSDHFLVLEK